MAQCKTPNNLSALSAVHVEAVSASVYVVVASVVMPAIDMHMSIVE